MPNAKIYVIHHDGENYPQFGSDTVIPILAGNPVRDGYRIAVRDTAGGICITDAEKQDVYSEFTALYYVWKNCAPTDTNSIVGFMHYRSFLDLRGGAANTYPSLESRFGYDKASLQSRFCKQDAIVSEPLYFGQGIYKQYDECHPMANTLFSKAKQLLSNDTRYRAMVDFFDEHFSMGKFSSDAGYGYFKCLLISTWKYFDAYCNFIFYLLDNLFNDKQVSAEMSKYKMIKGPDRPETQKKTRFRLLAFFAERMTSFFIAYAKKSGAFRIGTAERCHYTSMKQLVENVYPSFPKEKLRPVLRVCSLKEMDHMAVANLEELDTMKDAGYFCEGPLGYIYSEQVPGSTPVYRLRYSNGGHACTKNLECTSGYVKCEILGYSKSFPDPEKLETLHLEEYSLVGQPWGYVTTINPSEFPVVGYDPDRPYADKMADLGYLVDIWGRKH